jgi:hypothetical protein
MEHQIPTKPRSKRGPRTAAGKLNSSRNALKHGLAAAGRQSSPSKEMEPLIKAICGGDDDPAIVAAATAIAESDYALRAVRAQQIAVVDRMWELTAQPLVKGDNSRKMAIAAFMKAWLANREIEAIVPKLLEKHQIEDPKVRQRYNPPPPPPVESVKKKKNGRKKSKSEKNEQENEQENETDFLGALPSDLDHWFEPDGWSGIVPAELKALLEEASPEDYERILVQTRVQICDRDEHAALEAAAPDLDRLARYERRAWFRQKRAIYNFMNLKLQQRSKESDEIPKH